MATKKKAKKSTVRKTKKRGLVVETPISRHLFPDVEFLNRYADSLDWQEVARESKAVEDCQFLLKALKKYRPAITSRIKLTDTIIYRAVHGEISPLSVTGTFGCGGRLNIGAAQAREDFPSLKPAGGLYGSLDVETTVAENSTHGLPNAAALFELRPRRDLKLYSLDAVLGVLEPLVLLSPQRSLTAAVLEIPIHANWKYRKYPAVSQVVGAWLRKHAHSSNTDGITWPSVRKPGGRNVFIFVGEDKDALALFDSGPYKAR